MTQDAEQWQYVQRRFAIELGSNGRAKVKKKPVMPSIMIRF
jgi:hypothetical protein